MLNHVWSNKNQKSTVPTHWTNFQKYNGCKSKSRWRNLDLDGQRRQIKKYSSAHTEL